MNDDPETDYLEFITVDGRRVTFAADAVNSVEEYFTNEENFNTEMSDKIACTRMVIGVHAYLFNMQYHDALVQLGIIEEIAPEDGERTNADAVVQPFKPRVKPKRQG